MVFVTLVGNGSPCSTKTLNVFKTDFGAKKNFWFPKEIFLFIGNLFIIHAIVTHESIMQTHTYLSYTINKSVNGMARFPLSPPQLTKRRLVTSSGNVSKLLYE